jgi:hypothetical protein
MALALLTVLAVTSLAPRAMAQVPGTTPVDESTETPQMTAFIRPPGPFSDMVFAAEHDARYLGAALSHSSGKSSRIVSLLSRVDTFQTRVGHSLGLIMQFYSEYRRFMELVNQVKQMASYMKNYFNNFQLTINLYRLLPTIEIADPLDDQDCFVVGFLPKHSSDRWRKNAAKFGDNKYLNDSAFHVIQFDYPHSWNDLAVDASIWGNLGATMGELEFQQRMMAGVYDAVMSASNYLGGLKGVSTNLGTNARKYLNPENVNKIKIELLQKVLDQLSSYRVKLLSNAAGSGGFIDMSPDQVQAALNRIDGQIAQVQGQMAYEKDGRGKTAVLAQQQVWMERMNFLTQIIQPLEQNERKLTIATMKAQYDKYEVFWKDPGMMNPTPEITGMPAIDNSIYIIWQALTVLSWGKIPPPTPVSGGPAAEAAAMVTKGTYRKLMAEELRGIRQILTHQEQEAAKNDAVGVVGGAGTELAMAEAKLAANDGRIKATQAILDQRSKLTPAQLAFQAGGGF